MTTLSLKETVNFEHRGIIVTMELDYEKRTVSFVNPEGSQERWKFQDGTREYLGGWFLMLEAHQEAIKFADAELIEQEIERESTNQENTVNIKMSLSELQGKNKSEGR